MTGPLGISQKEQEIADELLAEYRAKGKLLQERGGVLDMAELERNEKETRNSLHEADHIINGERQDQYGKPEDSFVIIADFWNTYLAHRPNQNETLCAIDVAHMMSLFKHARMLGQKPKRDNYVDAMGYLAIAADRLIDA